MVEAGTGTGKTYVDLIPALLSGRGSSFPPAPVTCKTSFIIRSAGGPTGVERAGADGLAEGRGNYLCRYRLQATEQDGRLSSREQVAELRRIRVWAGVPVTVTSPKSPMCRKHP